METLRERQKANSREEMLAAAFKLFTETGYENTTMQDIADKANVGIATLFRYFGSKIGVLSAIILKDCEIVFEQGWEIAKQPPNSPVEAITKLLLNDLSILEKPSKKIRSEKFSWPGILTGVKEIDDTVRWGDEQVQLQLKEILNYFKERDMLAPHCDVESLTMILYYVTNQYYISYVHDHDVNDTPNHDNFVKMIALLFEDWLSKKGRSS